MEFIVEEYGQAILAMLVMTIGLSLVADLIINEGILNRMVLVYMQSICR